MFKLSVYLFHHTSFFAVCSTNSVTLGRKSVARKKRLTRGKLVYCVPHDFLEIHKYILQMNIIVMCKNGI